MFPRSLEPILEQLLELSIMLAVDTSEYLHIFQRQFKRSRFEPKVPRRVRQHETKVDMDEVTFSIQEYVSVMPVLDL